ncbi:MAG TPA: hypothetical protein VET26_08975 [Candidatus Sulfotelmatobacter sp.]|nr:hypothetical protein [Candidatus Sulfotelmatobacter sp.]
MVSRTVLSPADFFAALRKKLKETLPSNLRGFHSARGRGRLIKVHYGDPEFHYEAWHHTGDGRLEVGLHFEGPADRNRRAFEFFRVHVLEGKAGLPHAELEPWDRGWVRLYETIPAPHLDEGVVERGAQTMAAYIVLLQPLLGLLDEGAER